MAVRTCPKPIVVPIVFIPGIMGSRLRQSAGDAQDDPVWDPDSSGWKWDWYGAPPVDRRAWLIGGPDRLFNSTFLEVDLGNAELMDGRVPESQIDEKVNRGWGGVAWDFYGDFLNWLDNDLTSHLPDFAIGCDHINIEVWAHPYNWTDDNAVAAQNLSALISGRVIPETQAAYKDQPDIKITKPIIVTHSMGGLVGRAYSLLYGGAAQAHTLIHGAMPTHGSPAAYKRMRAGFEGIASKVLGYDAAEVAAILANSPGGLELLPNQFHKNIDGEKPWLKVTYDEDSEGDVHKLPKSDPFTEIYLNTSDWWRLLDPAHINPAGPNADQAFLGYKNNLGKAKTFHSKLGENGFHNPTKMFYCDSEEESCWDRVEWKLDNADNLDEDLKVLAQRYMSAAQLPEEDDGEDTIKFLLKEEDGVRGSTNKTYAIVKIQEGTAPGDGTVHSGSGEHVPTTIESDPTVDAEGNAVSYAHDEAYQSAQARQQVANWISEIIVQEAQA